jgi:hypothetical protein
VDLQYVVLIGHLAGAEMEVLSQKKIRIQFQGIFTRPVPVGQGASNIYVTAPSKNLAFRTFPSIFVIYCLESIKDCYLCKDLKA